MNKNEIDITELIKEYNETEDMEVARELRMEIEYYKSRIENIKDTE